MALLVLLILRGVSVVLYRQHKMTEVELLEKQQREREAYERLKATCPDLTDQECDLLVLNFLEFRIKEEAEILELSPNTVMKYRSNLLKKVGKEPIEELME